MVQQVLLSPRWSTHPRSCPGFLRICPKKHLSPGSDDGVDFVYPMVRLREVCGAKADELMIRYGLLAMSRYVLDHPNIFCVRHWLLIFVKIESNGRIEFAEVQFYFLHFKTNEADETPIPYALVSMYSQPNKELLRESSNTLWVCTYNGDDLRVVDLSSIVTCVSMQPLPLQPTDSNKLWFVVEKSGMDDVQLTGFDKHLDAE